MEAALTACTHASPGARAAPAPSHLWALRPSPCCACCAGFIGLLLGRTQADKFIMTVSQAVVLAFATALAILSASRLNVENAQACLICMAVMGFLVIPTALEMAAELAFPFSCAVASGALWACADVAVAVIGVTVDIAFGGDGTATTRFTDGGRWLLLACLALAALLWWLFPVRCAARTAPKRPSASFQSSSAGGGGVPCDAAGEVPASGANRQPQATERGLQVSRKLEVVAYVQVCAACCGGAVQGGAGGARAPDRRTPGARPPLAGGCRHRPALGRLPPRAPAEPRPLHHRRGAVVRLRRADPPLPACCHTSSAPATSTRAHRRL